MQAIMMVFIRICRYRLTEETQDVIKRVICRKKHGKQGEFNTLAFFALTLGNTGE